MVHVLSDPKWPSPLKRSSIEKIKTPESLSYLPSTPVVLKTIGQTQFMGQPSINYHLMMTWATVVRFPEKGRRKGRREGRKECEVKVNLNDHNLRISVYIEVHYSERKPHNILKFHHSWSQWCTCLIIYLIFISFPWKNCLFTQKNLSINFHIGTLLLELTKTKITFNLHLLAEISTKLLW